MNNKAHIDLEIIRIIYLKYKEYLLPVIFFIISWGFFIQFVIPEIQNFLVARDQVTTSEQTVAVITQNYNTLASLNDDDLRSLLNTANHALPQIKDFAGILDTISTAAGSSGVTLNDYSFQIGDINSTDNPSGAANQTVQITLTLKGDVDQVKKFIQVLSQQLPLSAVTNVSITSASSANITASFFYSPLPRLTFVDTSPLRVISAQQRKLLQDLAKNQTGNDSLPNMQTTIISGATPTPQLSPAAISSSGAR